MEPEFDASNWYYVRNTVNDFADDKDIIFVNALKNLKDKEIRLLSIAQGNGPIWDPNTTDIDLRNDHKKSKYYRAMLVCSLLMLKKEIPKLTTIGFGYASLQKVRSIRGSLTRLKGEIDTLYIEDSLRVYPEKFLPSGQPMPGDFIFSYQNPVIKNMIAQSFKDFGLKYTTCKCDII